MSTEHNTLPDEWITVTPEPYYECTKNGVFYNPVEVDKDGNANFKLPIRLSDEIKLIGQGTDPAGNYYRVIEWQDSISRKRKMTVIPMGEIGNNWSKLQSMGITILANRRKRELLADYLQTEGAKTPYTITQQAGWVDKQAYVLPNGDIISNSKEPLRVIYTGDKSQASAFAQSGTLEDWQAHVARYAAGNSRLCLTIGAAFAAPLVALLGMESGGFHLFGDSRDGKSTANNAALSVWGDPKALTIAWSGTSHGFTNIACARNDGLLVIDEIGQSTAHEASKAAYEIINGVGKVQGSKEGGNREIRRWNTILLSNGEKPLDSFFHSKGCDWNAGQDARLPSIKADADKGFGVFDTVHEFEDGGLLSDHIKQTTIQYHGAAGRAFVVALLERQQALEDVRQEMDNFMAALPKVNGQARTVALRFALAAAALEVATKYGITGLQEGESAPAIKQCFDAWLARRGTTGKTEDREIMDNAIAFMQRFAHSRRFVIYPASTMDDAEPTDLAGYRKRNMGEHEIHQDGFYILPAVFISEICKGFDKDKVCQVLHRADWLKRYSSGTATRWQHQLKGKGRFYLLIDSLPPSEREDPQED